MGIAEACLVPVSVITTLAEVIKQDGAELDDTVGIESLSYGWRIYILIGNSEKRSYYLVEHDKVEVDEVLDEDVMLVTPFSKSDDETDVYWVFRKEPLARHLAGG